MSAAEDLLIEFLRGGVARNWLACQSNSSEDPFLELKSSRTTDGRLTNDDKQNLGRNVRRFANTEGGLIVWGVTEVGAGGEKLLSLKPIPKVHEFVRCLK